MTNLLDLADLVASADLSDLRWHGDTVELSDGYTIRLVVESDPDTDIYGDGDRFGELKWERDSDYGSRRPSSMDGRAKILERDRWSSLWWQPPADVEAAHRPSLEESIRKILREGYYWVALELVEGPCDHCGRANDLVVASAGLRGVDDDGPDYVRTLVGEQQGELEWDLRQQANRPAPVLA
jgi:hypothetical protein